MGPDGVPLVVNNLQFDKVLNDNQRFSLSRDVSAEEIEEVVKNLNGEKAPGPDGFNGHFYKVCLRIIGTDLTLSKSLI